MQSFSYMHATTEVPFPLATPLRVTETTTVMANLTEMTDNHDGDDGDSDNNIVDGNDDEENHNNYVVVATNGN
jgi:hypothetical protein